MPHVIISGMPGIGKTTSVLCLARQLLGDSYKEAVLELNASDERGRLQLPATECLADATSRYRCCPESNQGIRAEEGHSAARSTKASYPRRGRQHDLRRSASTPSNDGNIFIYHPLCIRMQSIEQDHRTTPIALRHPSIFPIDRSTSGEEIRSDHRSRGREVQ